MATLYEFYNVGDDGEYWVNQIGGGWAAQTFKPETTHLLTSIWLKLDRWGEDITGNIRVVITETGQSIWYDLPPGDDYPLYPSGVKCYSNWIDSNLVTPGIPIWLEFPFTGSVASRALLSVATDPATSIRTTSATLNGTLAKALYAIVLLVPGGGTGNGMLWRKDITAATYDGGMAADGFGSVGRWFLRSANDFMFEDWGDDGTPCTCSFLYGLTTAYGRTATAPGTYTAGQSFSKVITGLRPGTLYHFKAKADNGTVIIYGSDRTFTTGLMGFIEII